MQSVMGGPQPSARDMAELEKQAFYHGLLPREDIQCLLKHPGEYILRKSEPTQHGLDHTRKYIISLGLPGQDPKNPDNTGLWIKHFVIQPVTKPKPGFSIDGKRFYDSVMELIEHHAQTKDPLNKSMLESVMGTGIMQQPWELEHDSITKSKKLGEGQFGEVWKGKLTCLQVKKGTPVDVAIKIAKATDMNKEKIKEVMAEARLMRYYDHPNVVRLYGVAVKLEPLMIVMEFLTGGALDEHLKKEPTSLTDKYNMMLGAAWGIEYLHTKGCIHRDLAARNCLVNQGVCKISDFGLSRECAVYKLQARKMIPMRWCAPEAMNTFAWTSKSDVFSFGVLVWEIFTNGLEPWKGISNQQVKTNVLAGQRLELPADMNKKLVTIIKSECWEGNPEVRKSMEQVARSLEEYCHMVPGENGEAIKITNATVEEGENKSGDEEKDAKAPRPPKAKSKRPRQKGVKSPNMLHTAEEDEGVLMTKMPDKKGKRRKPAKKSSFAMMPRKRDVGPPPP